MVQNEMVALSRYSLDITRVKNQHVSSRQNVHVYSPTQRKEVIVLNPSFLFPSINNSKISFEVPIITTKECSFEKKKKEKEKSWGSVIVYDLKYSLARNETLLCKKG